MQPHEADQVIVQRAVSAPPPFETALVTAAPSGTSITINVSGADEVIPAALDARLALVGDRVAVLRSQGRSLAVARFSLNVPLNQPFSGTVSAAPGGSTISVTLAGGTVVPASFLSTYSPTVSDVVELLWHADGSVTVLGKRGVVPTPPVLPPPPPPVPPAPPPAAPTTGTTTFPAIDAGSWRNGKWRTDSAVVAEYDWGGYGTNYGAWFYGTGPNNALAGATITGCRIQVSRRPGGTYGPQSTNFYAHGSVTRPAGDVTYGAGPTVRAYDIGETGSTTLPAAWGQAVVNLAGGIGIYGSPYVVLNGLDVDAASGALTLDWTR